MCNNNRDTFIATSHNVILAPDLCDRLFLIITLLNSRHTCLFHKHFFKVNFGNKEKHAVTLPHGAQRKNEFWGEIKQMSKSKKIAPKKKVALKLLHHILVHISTRSLIYGDTANIWKDIELRIYPDPFCTSRQMSSIKNRLCPEIY